MPHLRTGRSRRPILAATLLAVVASSTLAAVPATAAVATAAAPAGSPATCASAVPAGTSRVDVELDGTTYPVRVHVPDDARRDKPLPTVVNLHFSNGNADIQADYSGLDDVADREGFITVAPDAAIPTGDSDLGPVGVWNVPGVPTVAGQYPPAGARDDVAFLTRVIDTVVGLGCADPHRVYLTGHSGGARMASAYACAHPEKIAAVAPVAGLRSGTPDQDDPSAVVPGSCTPSLPVPVITFHGDADTTNPFEGNDDPRWGYPVTQAVTGWAHLDGCAARPRQTPVTTHVTRVTYAGCDQGAQVQLYRVAGGTHSWPGSDLDPTATQEVDAASLIWDFFSHRRR
ncbi:PHB depolymerase family esterase [Isoptericola sp. F-RaC21]|uniref:extracellular catalytic domain type 1 short-chain-length polyhydroxyalkanoate depolymerase n=1 Tax=Isoptericola sp. F-RaC21 TaxID=3141452 RepID=UPI00315B9D36